MAMKDLANRSGYHRHVSRRERGRIDAMTDWYGETSARNEILARVRPPVKVGDVMNKILTKLQTGPDPVLQKLADGWAELIGAETARHCRPATFLEREKRLFIEVSDSSWLFALDQMHKPALTAKIKAFTRGAVTELRFVAGGREEGGMGSYVRKTSYRGRPPGGATR